MRKSMTKFLQIFRFQLTWIVPLITGSQMNEFDNQKIYHRVWKVRATHIMLDRRTTIMAFIQCTDLHTLPAVTQT